MKAQIVKLNKTLAKELLAKNNRNNFKFLHISNVKRVMERKRRTYNN
jgi:hypothetical protein